MTDPDPRGLIAEAYVLDAPTPAQCRTIFLNWAISAPDTGPEALNTLLARHGAAQDHPMTGILRDAQQGGMAPRRRGGRRGRLDG